MDLFFEQGVVAQDPVTRGKTAATDVAGNRLRPTRAKHATADERPTHNLSRRPAYKHKGKKGAAEG